MPQRNNPMSAVQKKRTVSTTKKKGTTSSSKTSRTSKKEQMKHRTVMPVWIRNILAVMIVGCFPLLSIISLSVLMLIDGNLAMA